MDKYRLDRGVERSWYDHIHLAHGDKGKRPKNDPDLTRPYVVAGLDLGLKIAADYTGIEKVCKKQGGCNREDAKNPGNANPPQKYFSGFAHKLSNDETPADGSGPTRSEFRG